MKTIQRRPILLLVPLFLLCVACNATKPEVDEVPRTLRGSWVLAELEGADVAAWKERGQKVPEILIGRDGEVSGFGGVNRFGATLDLDVLGVERFQLSTIASTMMAGEPDAMALEQTLLQALQDTRQYRLKENRLELQLEEEQGDEYVVVVLAVFLRR